MQHELFRQHAHQLVDWIADYWANIELYKVRPNVQPGEIMAGIPHSAPESPEDFGKIFADFESLIMPGITHWQHPGFMAYFPANNSAPSVLAEMLTAALGAQCMIWQTSPAAAELEERMMQWLAEMCGLPSGWHGVIQDTASTATLCALLSARECLTNYEVNEKGLQGHSSMAVYCSTETHSSIEKGVKIAGLGRQSLRKIAVDEHFAMLPGQLEKAIKADTAAGIVPLCVVAATGTTSSAAMDPLEAIGQICERYGIWFHVDAAYAGTAAILPEKRWILRGVELADSYVFNPHKWMFTNFDCTAYYVKDKDALLRTFEIMPEYLKTSVDRQVNNYRDWGIQLGRRFRALKLWFVIREMGVEGIRDKLRKHIAIAQHFAEGLLANKNFRIMAPHPLNLVCFRYQEAHWNEATTDHFNERLLAAINATGRFFLTHTKLNGHYVLRAVFGQTNVEQHHAQALLETIAKELMATVEP